MVITGEPRVVHLEIPSTPVVPAMYAFGDMIGVGAACLMEWGLSDRPPSQAWLARTGSFLKLSVYPGGLGCPSQGMVWCCLCLHTYPLKFSHAYNAHVNTMSETQHDTTQKYALGAEQ